MNNRSGIELLSSGESLFIKTDSLKDSLYALFSQHKIEKLLKLLLLSSCNNRWSDIADGLHATLFPVNLAGNQIYHKNSEKQPYIERLTLHQNHLLMYCLQINRFCYLLFFVIVIIFIIQFATIYCILYVTAEVCAISANNVSLFYLICYKVFIVFLIFSDIHHFAESEFQTFEYLNVSIQKKSLHN